MIFFSGAITEKKAFLLFYPGSNFFFSIKIELIFESNYFKHQSNACPLANRSPALKPRDHCCLARVSNNSHGPLSFAGPLCGSVCTD